MQARIELLLQGTRERIAIRAMGIIPAREQYQPLDGERGEILMAEEDGIILGMASVSYNLATRYGGEYCRLEELVLDPSARGRNVGAPLLTRTVDRARARGCAEYGL